MPQTQYPSILAFVEGSMERLFFNKNFHYVRVIPIPNGSSWTSGALCARIKTLLEARNFSGDRIVVWLDRENRSETAEELSACLREAISSTGYPAERIAVLVGDRMTENVILADELFIRREFVDETYNYSHEGRGGKRVLAEMYARKDVKYKELVHGVKCMSGIRLSRSAINSPAVANFVSALDLPCWWIETEAA